MSERGSVINPLRERKAEKILPEFKVKIPGDSKSCYISDILNFKGTRMLLVDRNNNKMKMFGQDFKYQDSIIFEDYPWCACCISDSEVAVTMPSQKTIQIIEIKDKMQKVREIKTKLQCWGIAVMKDQLVITTCGDEHSVIILDMNGNEIRNVRPDSYRNDKLLCPWYIKVDTTNSTIFISYDTMNKLAAFDTTWNMRYIYTNRDLTTASGIDTDREGNIYLCGYRSHCVQQISKDGKLIKILIPKREVKTYPIIIRFYRDMDTFFVTYRDCDVVEVYNLRV